MENKRKKGDDKMDVTSVIVIIVNVVIAFIAVLVLRKSIKDHGKSTKERITGLNISSMSERISALETFMLFLRLDKEKVAKILFEAAKANNLRKLEYYMKIGVLHESDINMQDNDGRTFGHIAVKNKNKNMFDWFLRNGGRTNICGGEDDKSVDDIFDEDPEVQMWRSVNKSRQ